MTHHVWLPAIRANSGVDLFSLRLAAALQRAGVQATLTWLPRWSEFLPPVGYRQPPPGATIVHSSGWGARAFTHTGLPLVVTLHSASVRDPDWALHASTAQRAYYRLFVQRWEAAALRSAAKVTAVSDYVRRSFSQAHGAQPARVIHHWVDTQVFHPGTARAADPRRFRLLFVGNLTRRKGADIMLQVAEQLGSSFELKYVGQRQAAPARTFPANVSFVPPQSGESQMAELYRWSDALLVTSRSEGFGYATLESLACGRPVIASNCSALPEVIRDGETGLLCPPGDVDAFVSGCRRLADDASLHRQLGAAARDDAVSRFSEARAVNAYLDLYRELTRR